MMASVLGFTVAGIHASALVQMDAALAHVPAFPVSSNSPNGYHMT